MTGREDYFTGFAGVDENLYEITTLATKVQRCVAEDSVACARSERNEQIVKRGVAHRG